MKAWARPRDPYAGLSSLNASKINTYKPSQASKRASMLFSFHVILSAVSDLVSPNTSETIRYNSSKQAS